ncbi:MAG TPA: XrtA/PEP-CTERM system histidine kinase PrsK [Verrucomicrobiae bacterium]
MDLVSILFFATAAIAGGIAALAFVRNSGAPARRTFCVALGLLAVQSALAGLVHNASTTDAANFWRTWWLVPQALSPAAWLLFVLKYSRGNFSISFKNWLPIFVALTAIPLATITLLPENVLIPQAVGDSPGSFAIGGAGFILYLSIVLGSALILINLERTFRAAVGTMRWRLKYVILGTAAIFIVKLYTSSQVVLFKSHTLTLDIINSIALLIACALFLVGLLRSGLFRVEVYPSEKVLQFSVAGVLIGAYLVLIGLFSKIFAGWEGPQAFALKAFLLLSSLALVGILLVSERSRDKLRRFVSRHFHRPFYDYRSLWLNFTEKSATIVDADTLSRTVADWLSEHLRVLSTSVWLVDKDSGTARLAASTGVSAPDQQITGAIATELIQALERESSPFDIDDRSDSWINTLRGFFPDHFEGAGNRICVPLTAAGRLVGFCTLGDRVNYIPLELQELELLKCVGDQVASNLLNLQLSNRLIQSKEMEAFQTISAFFVHDLKNTASTLNLTLQNLPKHFDNPEFRKDALRAIGKSVNHIQELISRLTLFRQKLELNKTSVDLNACVREFLSAHKQIQISISTDLAEIRPVLADQEQLQKVLTNLVLNSVDALRSGSNGLIRISTRQHNGTVQLSVTDNGCGMSPDFIARSLFRPFQTTKKGGIGIGMFQSKAIIEAHGGRVEVQSELQKGTTFTISLPAC